MKKYAHYIAIALFISGIIGFLIADWFNHYEKDDRVNRGSVLLKEIVTKDIPNVLNATSDFQRSNLLREWAHSNIDWSSRSALLDQDKSFDFYHRSSVDIFSAFLQDRGGVWCGGTAYSLKRLYQLFGFEAKVVNIGKPGVMTHVVTLVRIKMKNRVKLVVQDATFDLTYVDIHGEPLDYFELISLLKDHKHHQVRTLYGNAQNGDFLLHPNDNKSHYNHIISLEDPPLSVLESGVLKFRSKLNLESFSRKFGKSIKEFLEKEGHPPNINYLFLYPIGGDQKVISKQRAL